MGRRLAVGAIVLAAFLFAATLIEASLIVGRDAFGILRLIWPNTLLLVQFAAGAILAIGGRRTMLKQSGGLRIMAAGYAFAAGVSFGPLYNLALSLFLPLERGQGAPDILSENFAVFAGYAAVFIAGALGASITALHTEDKAR